MNHRFNSSHKVNFIIFSPDVNKNIQDLSINNYLSSDRSSIVFSYIFFSSCQIQTLFSIKSSLSNQLAFSQDPISNLTDVNNPDPINDINNTSSILTDINVDIQNHLPEKQIIKSISSIQFIIELLLKLKQKIKRELIKTRNTFLKYALNVISKTILKRHKEPS